MKILELEKHANNIRKEIVEISYRANGSHIGCSLCIVDILTTLYFEIMNIDPYKPTKKDRDRLILSKGHACSALYATLAERGYFPSGKLREYLVDGSKIGGHTTYGSLPGIEATTGSLGHGLPIGTGIALALKNDNIRAKVYVIVGDGEAEEGSVWEAIMFAGHQKINNIVLIIDNNNLQMLGKSTEILNSYSFKNKLQSFGWEVKEVDGNNISELIKAFKTQMSKKPLAIIANTIKGKGVDFMENKAEWHGKALSEENYQKAIKQLTNKK